MERYIDANKLLKEFEVDTSKDAMDIGDIVFGAVTSIIEKQPTADVVEVKHGKWKQGVPYVCSICGKPAPDEKNTSERYSCWISPYCPHCGAKMDLKEGDV